MIVVTGQTAARAATAATAGMEAMTGEILETMALTAGVTETETVAPTEEIMENVAPTAETMENGAMETETSVVVGATEAKVVIKEVLSREELTANEVTEVSAMGLTEQQAAEQANQAVELTRMGSLRPPESGGVVGAELKRMAVAEDL